MLLEAWRYSIIAQQFAAVLHISLPLELFRIKGGLQSACLFTLSFPLLSPVLPPCFTPLAHPLLKLGGFVLLNSIGDTDRNFYHVELTLNLNKTFKASHDAFIVNK